MASVKSTFTLNEESAQRLSETAERLNLSKSEVVREAILDFSQRADRLSERERRHLLTAFDSLMPAVPAKPSEEVDAELEEVRRARQLADRS